jgi:hypothetical protein
VLGELVGVIVKARQKSGQAVPVMGYQWVPGVKRLDDQDIAGVPHISGTLTVSR